MSSYKNIRLLSWFNFCTDFKLYAPLAIIYFSQVSHSYALGASIFSITMLFSALFYGVSDVAKSTLLQKEFTDRDRATMGSLNSFAGSIAFAILAFTIGLFADKIGPGKAMLIIQGISFITLWVYYKMYKHDKTYGSI